MKEEALKLADVLDTWDREEGAGDLIRKLVAELDKQGERIAELEELVDELAGYKESYENCHKMCSGKGMN